MTPPTDTRRAPWEIEIREPGSEPPVPVGPSGRRGAGWRLLALVILGIACLVATGVLLSWLLGGGEEETDGASPATTTPITFAPREEASTTTAAPTTTATTTTTAAPATTTTTAPTTTTPASTTGAVPALSRSFGGGWVALLTSVPYAAGTGRLEAAYAELRGAAPDAVAARGEDWASLGDGYWVLVETGPFASEADVSAWCAGLRGARTDCAPRRLR